MAMMNWQQACERLGFEKYHTGGGCMAWSKESHRVQVLLTAVDDPSLPVDGEMGMLGVDWIGDDCAHDYVNSELVMHVRTPDRLELCLTNVLFMAVEALYDSLREERNKNSDEWGGRA